MSLIKDILVRYNHFTCACESGSIFKAYSHIT